MSASPHRQVSVRVNTQVEEGMAEIVFALGLSPAPDRRKLPCDSEKGAWVCFSAGACEEGDYEAAAFFIFGILAPRVSERVGDNIRLSLRARQLGPLWWIYPYVMGAILR